MRMRIEDVVAVPGRGVAVTGRLAAGTAVPDRALLLGPDGQAAGRAAGRRPLTVTVAGLERFRSCFAGDGAADEAVGLLLTGVAADEVGRGMLLCTED
ncbi:hypothetical protein AB0442_34640 [Kitasatospora sp. NPDC085895]|uniref:hypothetical protein n=1 Tax=Kitasatospora sp. NPDC085895 TaxID=3155057 RepID=UPI00344F8C37